MTERKETERKETERKETERKETGIQMIGKIALLIVGLSLYSPWVGASNAAPHYKPSSRSPEALDITTNSYGFSRSAPSALELGQQAADFTLPRAGGGVSSLAEARTRGPVVIIFYRGHW